VCRALLDLPEGPTPPRRVKEHATLLLGAPPSYASLRTNFVLVAHARDVA
jgi:hypothetical protein